jgi:hypothetical protein
MWFFSEANAADSRYRFGHLTDCPPDQSIPKRQSDPGRSEPRSGRAHVVLACQETIDRPVTVRLELHANLVILAR